MKQNVIISHTDLDGVISAVITKRIIDALLENPRFDSNSKTTQLFVDYVDLGDTLVSKLEAYPDTIQLLFITDISLRGSDLDKVLDWVEAHPETTVTWVDHHVDSDLEKAEARNLPNLKAIVNMDNAYGCAAKLLCRFTWNDAEAYKFVHHKPTAYDVSVLADIARDRDLWINEDERSLQLHMALSVLGPETLFDQLCRYEFVYSDPTDLILWAQNKAQEKYDLNKKLVDATKSLMTANGQHFYVAVCMDSAYTSELASYLANKYTSLVGVVMSLVGKDGVSFKPALSLRRPTESTVKLNEIAALLGGGGHERAAGATLVDESVLRYLQAYAVKYLRRHLDDN